MSGNNFVGSKISLISKAGIRYLGTLVDINAAESTVALENVMSFGTENRPCPTPYPPSKTSYNFVKFRGTDIADLHVFEQTQPQDPAIIEATQGPPNGNMPTAMVPPAQMSPGGPVAAPGNFSSSFSPNTSFTGQNTSGNFPAYSAQGAPTPANSFQEQNDIPKVSTPPRPVGDSESKNDHSEADEQRNESGNYRTSRGRSNNPRKNSYNNNNNNRRYREGMPYTNKTLSFEADFDFETSNAKFNKTEIEEEFAKKISKLTLSDPRPHQPETAAAEPSEEATEKSAEAAEDPDADQCYDRSKSFFDTISCEALEKESGQRRRPPSWHAERSLNSETFGEGVVTYQRRSYQSNNYRGNRSGMNGSYSNNYGNYGGNRYNSYNNYSGRNDHYNNYRGGYNNRNDGYNRSSGYRHADNGYNNRDGYRRDYRDGGYNNNNNNNNNSSNNRDNGYNNREHSGGYNNRENGYNRDRNYQNRDNRDNDRNNYQNRRDRTMRYNNDRNDEGQGRASYRRVERNGRPQAQTEAT